MAVDLADKDCKTCQGDGVIHTDNNYTKKCLCVLKNEFLEYVEPYSKAKFLKHINLSEDTKERDVFLCGEKEDTDSVIKTFLFHVKYTYKINKFRHESIDPETARMAYLHCTRDTSWQMRLRTIDFLIIKLTFDVRNQYYGETLLSLIAKRRDLNLKTWVISFRELEDVYLKKLYTSEFVKYVKDNNNMKKIKAEDIVQSAT
jgi:hypothetical protein